MILVNNSRRYTKKHYLRQMNYICSYIKQHGSVPPEMREWIVDNFAGGGGASTGIEMATGYSVNIAINHNQKAIKLHEVNHPNTKHFCESVWDVDPLEACEGNPVGLAWFSPDCRHFSKAKGATPVKKHIRGLAWVVLRWAAEVRPRVIMLENVPEFSNWGPLRAKRDKKTGRIYKFEDYVDKKGRKKTREVLAKRGEVVEIDRQVMQPNPDLKGKTFKRWCRQLQDLGYEIETKVLNAADYGAPTKRKRLFLIARCDGQQIVWPEATHAPRKSPAVILEWKKEYVPAHEIIDWSIPCKSIFNRAKPLAENTMDRIAAGFEKFVLKNSEPFIIQVNHTGGFRGQHMNDPLPTITGKNGYGIVTPYIAQLGQTGWSAERNKPVTEPLSTIVSKAEHCIVTPAMYPVKSEDAREYDGQMAHHGSICAFISKYFGGGYTGAGSSITEPLHTITGVDHNALCTSHVIQLNRNMIGTDLKEPLNTIVAGPGHLGEVRAFLMKYYGTGIGQDIQEPLGTVVSKSRFALVIIAGNPYILLDIGMRMLKPHELFAAQGFPSDYITHTYIDGRRVTETDQVSFCGNAVAPPVPQALVKSNLPELCKWERMPHLRPDRLTEEDNRQLSFVA